MFYWMIKVNPLYLPIAIPFFSQTAHNTYTNKQTNKQNSTVKITCRLVQQATIVVRKFPKIIIQGLNSPIFMCFLYSLHCLHLFNRGFQSPDTGNSLGLKGLR